MILGVEIAKKRSRPWPWIIWMTFVVLSSAFTPSTDRCDVAQSRCVQNPVCLSVLRRYLTLCSDLIDGPLTSVCWPRCRRTLPLLLDIPDGQAFVGCDCQHNSHCLQQRQRLQICSRRFGPSSMRPLLPAGGKIDEATTCSEAKKSCAVDKACHDALTIANVVCSEVGRRGSCDRTCRNSLRTLHGSNHGRQLMPCRCNDSTSEPHLCSALHQETKTLCLKRRSKQSQSTALGAITSTLSTDADLPSVPTTSQRHLINASVKSRMLQRSGADTIHSVSLVTEMTLPTTSGSAGDKRVTEADRSSRKHASAGASHAAKVPSNMEAANDSARKPVPLWSIYCYACWIIALLALRLDWN